MNPIQISLKEKIIAFQKQHGTEAKMQAYIDHLIPELSRKEMLELIKPYFS